MSVVARIGSHLRTSKTVMVSGGTLCAIALIAIVAPWISPNEYLAADFSSILRAPTSCWLPIATTAASWTLPGAVPCMGPS